MLNQPISSEVEFVDEIATLVETLQNLSFKTEADLARIVLVGMMAMSTLTQLKGLDKKKILIIALKKIINEQGDIESSDRAMLLSLIDVTGPGIIDAIFQAAQAKLIFNSVGGFCCFGGRQ